MKTLHIELGERSYPIYIGTDLLTHHQLYKPHIVGSQVLIVTNTTVAPLYLQAVRSALSHYQVEELILPDGESFKTLDVWQRILDKLVINHYARDCTLIALGGGVIGDITGYAAACYQRGVNFIQIPTTVLAQVDSSVGGKTGVNHPSGKNMIGAFHQPVAVLADITTLNTLAERELYAGFAEIIKYGLIRDAELFSWLDQHASSLLARQPEVLIQAIERSCQHKADIVAADERETGLRALLNLGHTFGHAIEAGIGYGVWLHGEAVATGTMLAALLSHHRGWLDIADVQHIRRVLKKFQLPTIPPDHLTPSRWLELMAFDKKILHGKIRFVLLKAIGQAVISSDVTDDQLAKTFASIQQR
jgi:3-dehydroquinate synthase